LGGATLATRVWTPEAANDVRGIGGLGEISPTCQRTPFLWEVGETWLSDLNLIVQNGVMD
jgi:hypothetical protein